MSTVYLVISSKYPDTPIPFPTSEAAEKAKKEMEKEQPEYEVSIRETPISHPDLHENGSSHIPSHPEENIREFWQNPIRYSDEGSHS